jgi:VanZ family protein
MRSWQVVAGLAVLAVAAQLYGVYRPAGPPTPLWFPNADKVEHAVGFGLPVALILAALTLRARQRGRDISRLAVVVVATIFVVHAVVSEIIQHVFYRSRTGDPLDVLADSVGIALGAGLYQLVVSRSRHRVRP